MSIIKLRKWFSKKLKSIMALIAVAFVISCFYGLGQFTFREEGEGGINPHVIANVNGEEITRREFDNLYSNTLRFYRQMMPDMIKPVNLREVKAGVLEQLIDRKLKLQEARKLRVRVLDIDIKNRIDELAKSFESERSLKIEYIHMV